VFNLQFSSIVHQAVKDVANTLGGHPRVFDLAPLYIVGTLAQIPGDYVEIGTWFGASALVTALVKKRAEVYGSITCIDLFAGPNPKYYQAYRLDHPSAAAVLDNAEKLGVELEVLVRPSDPWPKELAGRAFTVGYIDGDHRHPHPTQDATNLSNRVTKYLVFDDFSPNMKAVQLAVFDLLKCDPAWDLSLVYRTCAVLKRPSLDDSRILTYNILEWIDPEYDWMVDK